MYSSVEKYLTCIMKVFSSIRCSTISQSGKGKTIPVEKVFSVFELSKMNSDTVLQQHLKHTSK